MPVNWFDQGGAAYAAFRPDYPPELAAFLASAAPRRSLAVDVGCGTGQLTRLMASAFEAVIGLDPSADQIANATPHKGVRFGVAPAEATGLEAASADLITAAQAAHWFDLEVFYDEVRRIAAPGAVLALITYGVLSLDADLQERFMRFYVDEIGEFWPPERRLVDTGYAGMDFPFEVMTAPALEIRRDWSLGQMLGYLGTWSAVRRAREAGMTARLTAFAEDLRRLWGDPDVARPVVWPIAMRLGTVHPTPPAPAVSP